MDRTAADGSMTEYDPEASPASGALAAMEAMDRDALVARLNLGSERAAQNGAITMTLARWYHGGRTPIARYQHNGGSLGLVEGYVIRTAALTAITGHSGGYVMAMIRAGRISYYSPETLLARHGSLQVWADVPATEPTPPEK